MSPTAKSGLFDATIRPAPIERTTSPILTAGGYVSMGDCHIATGRARSVAGQEFSGCCDGGPPCVHRHSPKRAVRLS
jgi:hypothetical protein